MSPGYIVVSQLLFLVMLLSPLYDCNHGNCMYLKSYSCLHCAWINLWDLTNKILVRFSTRLLCSTTKRFRTWFLNSWAHKHALFNVTVIFVQYLYSVTATQTCTWSFLSSWLTPFSIFMPLLAVSMSVVLPLTYLHLNEVLKYCIPVAACLNPHDWLKDCMM